MKTRILISAIILAVNISAAQSSKMGQSFGRPIISDSASTILIPTVYDASLFSSNKLAVWGNYYSNIIFYDFKNDSTKKLFANDTYIVNLERSDYFYRDVKTNRSITTKSIFYQVMNYDRNKNGKIDGDDPVILYVSDTHGNGLRSLTPSNENVVDLQLYEKQNFALVKIQRDSNNDDNFTSKDTDYYYIKLNLTTMAFGKKIELK